MCVDAVATARPAVKLCDILWQYLQTDWTFIAFTYDGTNSIGYMNDNIPVSDPGGTTEFNRFRIGKNRNGNTYFTGAIDELRIYNRALTASEISSLFAN